MTLELYEEFYYTHQKVGRGISDAHELHQRLSSQLKMYEEQIGTFIKFAPKGAAIDLGCGYGNFLFYLRSIGREGSVGFDLSVDQVSLANELGLDARVGNALEVLDNYKELAIVSMFDLIEHLDKNSAVRLLLKAFSSLKNEGLIIIQCPCADGFRGAHDLCNDLTHRWAPTSTTLTQMLLASGFNDVTLVDLTLPPFPNSLTSRAKNLIRICSRKLARPFFLALGIKPPRIWSNSMIAIAKKL